MEKLTTNELNALNSCLSALDGLSAKSKKNILAMVVAKIKASAPKIKPKK